MAESVPVPVPLSLPVSLPASLPVSLDLSLTTALALLGGVLLLALLLHSLWSARRARPRLRDAVRPQRVPASGGDADRTEPSLDGVQAGDGSGDGSDDSSADAATGAAGGPPHGSAWTDRPARKAQQLDALIDALVPLTLEAPVSGDAVLQHLPSSRRAGSKAFHVEGLDTDSGQWEAPSAGRRYGELQVGVQLSSRAGPLNEIEYSEFVQKVQAFAESVGAMPDFPDMLEVVARARELDALAGPLDAQLTLTLRANSVAWSVGYVQQCAARHGFRPGAMPGRLVLPAAEDGAPPLLSLGFDAQAALSDAPQSAALREVQLTLDVPQSPAAAEPFPAWHRTATALAEDMDASAVDDQGRLLTLHAYAGIGQELAQLYARLEALDLAAGTPAARRLFS